jgi:hypothetical protein
MLHACLYTICFVFCYTSWRFYAFSRTNLLMRRHSVSSLFCSFCVSKKLHRKYSWNWTKQKPKFLFFPNTRRSPKMRRRGTRGRPDHPMARATPWPHHGMVWAPGPLPDAALLPIYSPRRQNLKAPINFPRNLLQAVVVVDARSGGSRISSRHHAGGLLHHHGHLRSDV